MRDDAPSSRVLIAAASALGLSCAHAADASSSAAPDDRGARELTAALHASGPHRSLGDEARLFDRFVGTWDADFATFDARGIARRFPGEVVFGWIIDGWALQDVWIFRRPDRPEPGIGTSVRFYDAKRRRWRVTWIHPATGTVILLEGGAEGDRIVLLGTDTDGSALRWSFNEIEPDRFVWRGETSSDGGRTWRLEEEHRMRRRPPGAPRAGLSTR